MICRAWICAIVLLTAAWSGLPVSAVQCDDGLYGLADVKDAPRFDDYLVSAEKLDHPVSPVLASRDAREYRTMLRQAAAQGPNFAGHYTVAVWGCGAGCTDFGIIDSKSGQVFFENDLRHIVSLNILEPEGQDSVYDSLRFRTDSRLLVVLGAPGDNTRREGVAFYEWTGSGLKLLRFVPRARILAASCR